jgi:hypothetical protein
LATRLAPARLRVSGAITMRFGSFKSPMLIGSNSVVMFLVGIRVPQANQYL